MRAQVGAVLLTAQHAPTERGQTIFYIVAQFVFGCAVCLISCRLLGQGPACLASYASSAPVCTHCAIVVGCLPRSGFEDVTDRLQVRCRWRVPHGCGLRR